LQRAEIARDYCRKTFLSMTPEERNAEKLAPTVATEAKVRTALDESDSKGGFKRVDAAWRNWIKVLLLVHSASLLVLITAIAVL
jgi:hypothetical protein